MCAFVRKTTLVWVEQELLTELKLMSPHSSSLAIISALHDAPPCAGNVIPDMKSRSDNPKPLEREQLFG